MLTGPEDWVAGRAVQKTEVNGCVRLGASQGCGRCLIVGDTLKTPQQQIYLVSVGEMANPPTSTSKQNGMLGNSPITRITIARGHKGELD